MPCSAYTSAANATKEAISSDAFIDAALCGYQLDMGGPTFATLVWGGIAGAAYAKTESVFVPLALALVIGGVITQYVAAPAVQLLTIVLLIVGGLPAVLIARRLERVS